MASDSEPESRRDAVHTVMGLFVPLAVIFASLRLYSRIRFSHIGIDDVLIFLALIMLFGFVSITLIGIKHGMTRHIETVSHQDGIVMEKCGFASQVTYPAEMALVKVSILLFLVRVLPTVHPARVRLRLFAAFIAVAETIFIFCLIFQCSPVHAYWERDLPGRKCFDQPTFYYVDASFNILADLCILIIPTLLFRKLKVPRKQKYGVIALCSAGVFTLVSSILRLPYLHNLNQSKDPTWDITNIVIWSCAEFSSGIIFACVPTVKPIYTRIRKRCLSQDLPSGSGDTGTTPHSSDWKSHTSPTLGSTDDNEPARYLRVEDHYSLESLTMPGAAARCSRF